MEGRFEFLYAFHPRLLHPTNPRAAFKDCLAFLEESNNNFSADILRNSLETTLQKLATQRREGRENHELLERRNKSATDDEVQEGKRINEIRQLRQRELYFAWLEACRRYDLAKAAVVRYNAIKVNIEERPGDISKIVSFWDGEHKAIIAGSVEVSQRPKNQVKELNDLRDKLQLQRMTCWKKKVRTDEIRQFKHKVGVFLSLQKDDKWTDIFQASDLHNHALQEVRQLEENAEEYLMSNETVGPEHVDKVVSSRTGIHISTLDQNEKEWLVGLAEKLHQKVVRQDQAIRAVEAAVMRSRAGLGRLQQTTASFLFLGPTSVGKTELANALAEQTFDNKSLLIEINT